MTLQAYVDESGDDDSGIFVMGGCIATVQSWEEFSIEWERMLPDWGILDRDNTYHFHFREMIYRKKENIGIFFDTLHKYSMGYMSAKINKKDLKNAIARISAPGLHIDWDYSANPHFLLFSFLMDTFHQYRPDMSDYFGDEPIDFYFDNHINKKAIISSWGDNLERRTEEMKKYYGATPRFEDDKIFLPLQGADLIAGIVREAYLAGQHSKEVAKLEVKGINRTVRKNVISLATEFDEDQIAKYLKRVVQHLAGSNRVIYDSKFSFY